MAKNEYQSLVSPVVRIGGLPSVHHRPMMKASSARMEMPASNAAPFLRDLKDMTDAARAETIAPAPNHMNSFHPIMTLDL
jgi:hypothetical protein